MKFRNSSSFVALAVLSVCYGAAQKARTSEAPAAGENRGAFYTHSYPNLFRESGHSEAQIREKIHLAYQQLFHGKADSETVFFSAGRNAQGPLAYILDTGNQDVRTEGMSYGMMIAVQMDRRDDFDALWNWARTYMYQSDSANPAYGYYAWSCKPTGEHMSDTPAPDGEEYFAMALYFASGRWGDGEGIYDYHARADELLRTMLHRKEMHGPTAFGVKDVGAEFSEREHMVRFVPDGGGRSFTDPSYHLPGFYELWARWGPVEDRAFWAGAARTSRAFFNKAANPRTGLSPVYANFDGTPHATSFPESDEFGHDAWRVASNWSWDWAWFHADPQERELSDREQEFFASQGPHYGEVFTLTGAPLSPHPAAGLVAANAAASLAATPGSRSQEFVEALWVQPLPTGQFRYYDGMLCMLSWLHVSGQFRIWAPAWAAPEKTARARRSTR